MSLAPIDQFKRTLEESKEILILIPENPSGDAVGSAFALYAFLEKRGAHPTIAFGNPEHSGLSPKFSFLPKPERLRTEISGARDFVLSFDTTHNQIMDVRTERKDNQYLIHVTPEKGSVDPRDFSFILAKFHYELTVVIDSPDLEHLGKIYEKNPDLFFEVPIINIDHRSNNENFGQINLIDVTASACSEILFEAMRQIDETLIDTNIASALLTGIISATDSFQRKNTTPKSMLIAATLMDKGAQQQEIVRWLYKTHSLPVLKLWGRATARLNWDEKSRLAWTELTLEDFIQSRATTQDVSIILEKLQENYADGLIFMALYNSTPTETVAEIKSDSPEVMRRLHQELGGRFKRDSLTITLASDDLGESAFTLSKKIKEMGF